MAAIDQSAPALRAAELATDIAIKFEAELVLLTVVRPVDDQDPTLESYLQAEHIHDPIGVVNDQLALMMEELYPKPRTWVSKENGQVKERQK